MMQMHTPAPSGGPAPPGYKTTPYGLVPTDLDPNLYDPETGFGLYGTPAFGTRLGEKLNPLAGPTRPLCMEYYNTGICTRKGPHNQGCMYRHERKGETQEEIAAANGRGTGLEAEHIMGIESKGKSYTAPIQTETDYAALSEQAKKWAANAKERAKQEAEQEKIASKPVEPTMENHAQQGAPAPLPEGWTSTVDRNTGKTYYYNIHTRETRWTVPTAADAPPRPANSQANGMPQGQPGAPGAMRMAPPQGYGERPAPY